MRPTGNLQRLYHIRSSHRCKRGADPRPIPAPTPGNDRRRRPRPSPPAVDGSGREWPRFRTTLAANSNHSGGVNMGFLDGSVKFIKNSINLGTYAAPATKAGGEIIDAGAY
jgi:prepilin-type processing-associated H-X9-DG protein